MWTSIPSLSQVAVASTIPLSNPTVLICKQVGFFVTVQDVEGSRTNALGDLGAFAGTSFWLHLAYE